VLDKPEQEKDASVKLVAMGLAATVVVFAILLTFGS